MDCVNVGILTISDRCFAEETQDLSGLRLCELIEKGELFKAKVVQRHCCPDELFSIKNKLISWCDSGNIDLILTTGGTGVAPRDVTFEAVKKVIMREVPGISQKMLMNSLQVTPLAMLSRPFCGIREETLIITLPGSAKASEECLRFVSEAIPHAIDLIKDRKPQVQTTHSKMQSESSNSPENSRHHQFTECKSLESNTSNAKICAVSRRVRRSPYPMISVEEAQETVLSFASNLLSTKMNVTNAINYALAEDVFAAEDLPPFRASIKDGYAVLVQDGVGPRKVINASCAGSDPHLKPLIPGFCTRISTGAPLPPNSDAIVQVEDTLVLEESDDGKEELEITILNAPSCGQDIRQAGSDIAKGARLFLKGQVIGPSELGVLVSAGVTEVLVTRKPVVAVLSTGNELQDPSTTPLLSGHIFDSNKVVLSNLLAQSSFSVYDAGIAKDDVNDVYCHIRDALRQADVLVTSGGVSMGEKDLLRPVLEADFGAKIHFAQVFMKPGKPTTFATCQFDSKFKLILGLPGNPVSAVVTSHLYLLPLCKKLAGFGHYGNSIIKVKLSSDVRLDPRPEYQRAMLSYDVSSSDIPVAVSTGDQISSRLLSMNAAQVLLQLPPRTADNPVLPAGSVVPAILLRF